MARLIADVETGDSRAMVMLSSDKALVLACLRSRAGRPMWTFANKRRTGLAAGGGRARDGGRKLWSRWVLWLGT